MAHHVEPMDIDGESDFDNKENAYQHSNVLPRTPSTEKGYEDLDVSELNMKLRYSITPAASPMSKSMSHCLDNRYNASTDESLNNTVINENNLTRSLNSTLSKTDVSVKTLPLQALSSDLVDCNRNSNILRELETTSTNKDVTVTVNNGNELDCLSIPSSSSSMAHTPEATTPTKEIPKNDGGSPIMRGLKSVLSMFRSSQSPIPPSEVDNNLANDHSHVEVAPEDPKPLAVSSTPISLKSKETNLSRRSSPHKESLVFNEDLEKELQWHDDSTIVFSTEKIPIHKLFFQDKPSFSKTNEFCAKKEAEADMSVEYMDISYNDISVKDKTLNATVNKTNNNDVTTESDGEFVDCEATFTEESQFNVNQVRMNNDLSMKQDVAECDIVKNEVINPGMDTTQDIIKLLDSTQFTVEQMEAEKQLDCSSADIVNRLSDLINASENETTVAIIDDSEKTINESPKNMETALQLESSDDPLKDNGNELHSNNITAVKNADNVSIPKDDILQRVTVVPDILDMHKKSTFIEPSHVPLEVPCLVTDEVLPQLPKTYEINVDVVTEINNEKEAVKASPTDIPLPIDNDLDEINDNPVKCSPSHELQDKMIIIDETSNIVPMHSLEKTIECTPEKQVSLAITSCEIPCPPSVLSSDVSLPNVYSKKLMNNTLSYEVTTDASSLVLPQTEMEDQEDIHTDYLPTTVQTPDIISNVDNSLKSEPIIPNKDTIDSVVNNSPAIALVERETKIETSIIKQNNEKLQDVSAMDVSMVCDTSPLESVNFQKHNSCDPVEGSQNKNVLMDTVDIPSNSTDKNEGSSSSLPVIKTVEELTSQNESESLKEVNNPTAETLDTVGSDDSKIAEIAPKEPSSDAIGTITLSSVLPDAEKSNDASNINKTYENISDIVNPLNVTTTTCNVNQIVKEQCIDASIIPEMAQVPIINEISSTVLVKDNVNTIEFPTTLDEIEKPKQPNEKIDEEVVLSEGNSPFVSMSAAELDPEVKDSKEVNNEHDIKEEICTLPPSSPKIVSKGYNFNFDDLDSMDPFATKTKIRKSPPPAISPNTPIQVSNKNTNNRRKTMPAKKNVSKGRKSFNSTFDSAESAPSKLIESQVDERVNYNENVDAKIMKPDLFNLGDKVPLHTDTLDKIKVERKSKESDSKMASTEIYNIGNAIESVVIDENKIESNENTNTDSNNVINDTGVDKPHITSVESDPNKDACTKLKEVQDDQADSNQNIASVLKNVTDQGATENNPVESVSNKDITMDLNDIVSKPFKTSTMIDEIVMSDSSKAPQKSENTSSSEQSTYYSAGTSSTECEAKNVFNLPEIDDTDFNPFATKSKMRQTPPPDLITVNPFIAKCNIESSPEVTLTNPQKYGNVTVTMDNDDTKESPCDLSTCSSESDDKEVTVQEVHTEDEDTIEGPFLEVEDVLECEKMTNLIDDKDNGNSGDFDDRNGLATDDNEMFIDAEAFEFLMNQNKADEVAYSGKESLFLKFDPLFARRLTSEGVASALNELKKRHSTPMKASKEKELISFDKPGPSDLNVTYEASTPVENQDDINVTMSKPMMVVPPAVNPVVSPKKCATPTRANRLSMTFTSPAMAVIDRLLSLSSGSPSAGLDTTVTYAGRDHNEADQALTQLRELLAEKEINVYNLRCESKELKDRLSTLETQMKSLEAESEKRLKKINELSENLADKTKMNKNMAKVVEEYERTIASLISETEQDKKRYAEERNQLVRERDEQSTHLASMEVSFSDLHSKYEKSKQVIMGYKSNEDAYKNSLKEFEENLSKMHSNYELLKQHATSKLNNANQELEKLNKAHESEVLKLNAMIKRKDLHITSLEESLAQKTKANEELTAICDELINKVG